MTELQLYGLNGLFHNIVKKSTLMQGRYCVLPEGSNALNAASILTGVELPTTQRYPLVACLPPTHQSAVKKYIDYYRLQLIFAATLSDGYGQPLIRDAYTNTEQHRIEMIWQDMNLASKAFVAGIAYMQDKHRNFFFIDSNSPVSVSRFAMREKDRLSGVVLTLTMCLPADCLYDDIDLPAIEFPASIHNPHQM